VWRRIDNGNGEGVMANTKAKNGEKMTNVMK